MARELIQEYVNPDYPLAVNFVERKKSKGALGELSVRPTDIEMIVVNNGELRIDVGDKTFRATPGKGLIIFCGVEHRMISSEKEDTGFYSVVFSPELAISTSEDNSLSQKYFQPLKSNGGIAVMGLDEDNLKDEAVLNRINDIIAANTIKRHGYEILTKGYLCLLWGILLDYVSAGFEKVNGINLLSHDELRVKSAIEYMEENLSDIITLDDIADKIHVSKNECCRCFKRVTGFSPIDYLNRLRILNAARTLYKDPLSIDTISELALSNGFNNTSYFNRMFKRFFECTPTEYSKMLKEDTKKAKELYEDLQMSIMGV